MGILTTTAATVGDISESKMKVLGTLIRKIGRLSDECMADEL